jgi:broad specificity phosphatase PhoE
MTRSNTESWPALRARLDKVCRALAAAHPEESILLVTHGGPIEVACPALDPRVDPRAKVRYTCLSVFQPDAAAPAGFTCVLHADASHAGL